MTINSWGPLSGHINDDTRAFALAAVPPTALYIGGQEDGVIKSIDNGYNWTRQNNGLWTYPFILDIEIDPQTIDNVYVAADCKGGLRSTDGGGSWQPIFGNNLPSCMDTFVVDPTNSGIIYGGGEGGMRGPWPVGAIVRSMDGGANFSQVHLDPVIMAGGRQRIQAMAIAPSSANIIYAAGENEPVDEDEYGVVLRSTDGGQTWASVLALPFESDFFALAIHPTDSNIVLAGGRAKLPEGRFGLAYRSTDGGTTWEGIMTTPSSGRNSYIASLVFYQADPEVILAANGLSQVFRSEDGGDSWIIVKENNPDYSGQYLAIDPEVPDEVYLGGGLGYVGKSSDGGLTWTGINDEFRQGTPDELAVTALVVASTGDQQTFWASFIQLYKGQPPAPPLNQPPTAEAGGPYTVGEGGSVVVTSSASDPDGDPLFTIWDLDNDGYFETLGESVPFPAEELDGPSSHTIVVEVTDDGGLSATDQATVEVLNVAPSVGAVTVPADPIDINAQPVSGVSAPFGDPGTADTHICTVDYGDGTGAQEGTAAGGTCMGPGHTYAEAGVYAVTVTVADDDGGSDSAVSETFVVIYDPEGGFVTGGGWIVSPEGACQFQDCANDTTGKANFGFVSKYKKGATVPTGQTQFQFKAGDLNFHSDSYQWLVVAGHKAMYKGDGTINGAGNYDFMISAIDEKLTPSTEVDLFRIKIWDKDSDDTVVYDNQMDDLDDADPTTAIGGGNIVIHKK